MQESCEGESEFLKRKLFGGSTGLSDSGSLGAMLCRVSAFVSPRHRVASDLVANHMAPLLACDSSRKATLSTYVAEPKLAIAAASELWSDQKFFTEHGIPALQKALLSGALSNGIRGEVAAQIILLMAFDRACEKVGKAPGALVSLKSVLVELLPLGLSESIAFSSIPADLEEATIACCQFVNVVHDLSRQTLLELAARHCGATLREGKRGADIVIPFENGVVIFQIKNLKTCQQHCGFSRIVCEDLLPSKVFSKDAMEDIPNLDRNCVRVFLQVGAGDASAYSTKNSNASAHITRNSRGTDHLAQALEIYGVEPRCLTERAAYVDALKMLVHGSVDLEAYVKENADVTPNPDHDGVRMMQRIRKAWPFVLSSGSPVLPIPSGRGSGKRERDAAGDAGAGDGGCGSSDPLAEGGLAAGIGGGKKIARGGRPKAAPGRDRKGDWAGGGGQGALERTLG